MYIKLKYKNVLEVGQT